MRAHPGRRGLTLEEINKGSYGVAPENAEDMTMAQRGSARANGVPRIGYHIRKKSDIWSDNAAMLYEEAVQRQWSSATDIPWDEIEAAAGRHRARVHASSARSSPRSSSSPATRPAQWLPQISNEHYEVKMFLASQIMDEARHLDVFRKRALANGGGLLSSQRQRRPARDHRGEGLHRDVGDHARAGRGPRAVDLPHGRVHRHERGREAHLPALRRRTSRATLRSASCT